MTRKILLVSALLCLLVILGVSALSVNAGDRVLSNNTGTNSATFTITGEQSLVINGFDLTPLGLALPARIDRISIDVETAVPGAAITAVVYQDSNGGSPVDAQLVGQAPVNITGAGVFTAVFPTPIQVNAPVVWVGFYLPVNFKFRADQSGSSVLTYWAWAPGGTFDLGNLGTAPVLGPSNGTAPVNLNLNGIARITAEISGAAGVTVTPGTPAAVSTPLITQIAPAGSPRLQVLKYYPPACDTLAWDTEDVGITYQGTISVGCNAIFTGYAPQAPNGYERKQLYYDITLYDVGGNPITTKIREPITHCMKANPSDIDRAVIAIAFGSPRTWEILPTLRVGELICAEIRTSGGLSYLVPR